MGKMLSLLGSLVAACSLVLLSSLPALAAHPLITDDTGTQGKTKFQIEVNGEYAGDSGVSETSLGLTLSAGLRDNLDLVIGLPYVFLKEKDAGGGWQHEQGLSDLTIELKWRFFERDGLSLALKPGATLDTGDEKKGLSDGTPSYHLFFIATKDMEPLLLHMNLGYVANRKELRDILQGSLAVEYALSSSVAVVGNVGGETNPDRRSAVHPLFALAGMIFHVTETVDLDIGIKAGLNKAEPDYALLAGIALRF